MDFFPRNQIGNVRGYANKLVASFHIDMKMAMRSLIGLAYKKFYPAIKASKIQGWKKDHVAADLESFEFIARMMKHPLNIPHMNGWRSEDDANYKMLKRLFEMKAVVQEHDSFYDMLILLHYKWVHDHWSRYERSAEEAYQMFNFPMQYEALISHLKAMEEPLPDITDEPDLPDENYLELWERAKNGME